MLAQHPNFDRERELLLEGFTVADVVEKMGGDESAISKRHRNILPERREAFRHRIERDGLPKDRVPTDIIFKAWFVGLIDGDGYLQCGSTNNLCLRIKLREDDVDVIQLLENQLGVGNSQDEEPRETSQASRSWRCYAVKDLAEVLVPIFDEVPLRSKKRKEYVFWRSWVMRRYYDTLAGTEQARGFREEYKLLFADSKAEIDKIRHPYKVR